MRKRIYFLLAVITLFCACKDTDGPDYSGTPAVSFVVERLSPLMFKFTNTSYNCSSFRWDFGDGTYSEGKDAMKSFDAVGNYTVTLSGTASDGKKYYNSQVVEVTRPTIYIVGYTLYSIPYEDRYYKIGMKDDNLLPSDWDWSSIYTPMLNSTDLPYTYMFQNIIGFYRPETHDYYTVYVYRNKTSNGSESDTQCLKQKLYVKDLLQYKQEYVLETTGTAIGIKVDFEY